jgi:hypothetical protein
MSLLLKISVTVAIFIVIVHTSSAQFRPDQSYSVAAISDSMPSSTNNSRVDAVTLTNSSEDTAESGTCKDVSCPRPAKLESGKQII